MQCCLTPSEMLCPVWMSVCSPARTPPLPFTVNVTDDCEETLAAEAL
ncbi:MAG: hypothetical protein ACLT3I_01370 [Ruminococcus sp.]